MQLELFMRAACTLSYLQKKRVRQETLEDLYLVAQLFPAKLKT